MLEIKIKSKRPEPDLNLKLDFAELEIVDGINGISYDCMLVATRRGLSFRVMSKRALNED